MIDEPVGRLQALGAGDAGHEVEPRDPRGERAARAGEHLARRPLLRDDPVGQHDHAVGEHQRVERGVGDEDSGPPAVAEGPAQQRPHRRHGVDVQRREGLVEQQQVGARGERAGERDPLLLAAGELRRPPVGEPGHVDGVEQLPGAGRRGAAGHPLGTRPERDVGQRGEVREQQGLLGEEPDATPVRGHVHTGVGERPATDPDVPGVGPQQAGEDVEQRRLARPVGAEDGQHVARVDGDRDVQGEAGSADDGGRVEPRSVTGTVLGGPGDAPAPARRLRVVDRRRRVPVLAGHDNPSVGRVRPTAMTTTATATSRSDSATAPATSVSRSR